MTRLIPTVAILGLLTLTTACGDRTSTPAASGTEPKTMIGKAVHEATDEARRELATENIGLSTGVNMPKGEITPQGDLLIGGEPTTIDAKQRALLLDYRKRIVEIAETGMTIGVQGADLAGKAIGDVIGSVFSGNTDEVEKKIEAEAKGIEKSADRLCALLPGLLSSQEALAQSLPAFKPYATMTQKDVDECRTENLNGGEAVGQAIESAFNGKVKIDVNVDGPSNEGKSDGGMNAAEEAEAASAETGAKTKAESEKR